MHKNNGATMVFPETAIPKLPKILSEKGIFKKIKLQISEKTNLPQKINLSLTFKTLGTVQNNFSCSLVMFRSQSYSKYISKHYDFFPYCVTYTCHLPLLRKLKKQFHRLLLHIFNMKWTIGFWIVNGIAVISIFQIYDTEFDWSFL